MKFSVIIPTYNRVALLAGAVQSILDQSFTDWELILVDDGSTDDTRGLAKSLNGLLGSERFIYLQHETNKGVAPSYLDGIKQARGEYVVFQDSDDVSYPDRLARIAQEIGDADVLYHGIYSIAQSDANTLVRKYKPALDWEAGRILKEQYLPGISCIRTSLAKKIRVVKQDYGAWDWKLHLELDRLKAEYKKLDIGLYEYRRYNGSLSTQNEVSGRRKESVAYITKQLRATKRVGRNHTFGKGFAVSDL